MITKLNNSPSNEILTTPTVDNNLRNRNGSVLINEATRNAIAWPFNAPADPSQYKIRVVRTKLFHKNGQVSQMILHMPDYTMFIACHQEAVKTMNDYIGYLASKWIGITKYHTEFGVLKEDGSFAACPVPFQGAMETIIPEGSIFIPGTKGTWVTPEIECSNEKGGESC